MPALRPSRVLEAGLGRLPAFTATSNAFEVAFVSITESEGHCSHLPPEGHPEKPAASTVRRRQRLHSEEEPRADPN